MQLCTKVYASTYAVIPGLLSHMSPAARQLSPAFLARGGALHFCGVCYGCPAPQQCSEHLYIL
jgi:hypothetical protein